ncbi:MAG: hypothetical protein JWO36_1353 [Myxococcales bacterium]|nr:hypothetical protein [Myxococcales bacterium]
MPRATMRAVTRWLLRSVLLAGLVHAPSARAECPTTPDDTVCRPWTALFLPTAFGVMYAPNDASGPWYGGGFEATLLAWSDNSQAFGPSQGRLRFDIGVLKSSGSALMDPGTMAMYRGGVQVSLERNASRRWLIPYFNGDVGGLWTRATGSRAFVDGGFGVYVLHVRSAIIDLEVDGILPFSDPSKLGGVRAQLALSFALW